MLKNALGIIILLLALAITLLCLPYKDAFLNSLLNLNQTIPSLASIPFYYIVLAIAVLPTVGFPLSPLYLFSAALYGPLNGFNYVMLGVVINLSLTYWLANSVIKQPLLKLLNRIGYQPPILPRTSHLRFIIATRLMPGVPFTIQNYLLSLSGISFNTYFIPSIAIQCFWAGLFCFTAGAILQSNTGFAILGICATIAIILFIRIFKTFYKPT